MRIPIPKERSLASAILGFANGFAGVCEWLEAVESGEEPVRAAKKAYKNVRRRKVAVKKAERELTGKSVRSPRREGGEDEENEEGNGVVIDAMPRIRREGR